MRRAAIPLAAVALVLVAPAVDAASTVRMDADLQVASVSGREVILRMPLPATTLAPSTLAPSTLAPSAQAPTIEDLAVVVGGTKVPASASLDDPTTATDPSRPTTALLVLDTSGSMKGERIAAARQAAAAFVADLPAQVSVGLVTFADQASLLQAPTRDRPAIGNAIEQVQARGDTALHDAIALAAQSIPGGEPARIVLLSDGADTSSSLALGTALRVAGEQGSPIDVIALQPTAEQSAILARIADANGGRLLTARQAAELGSAFVAAGESFARAVTFTVAIPDGLDGRLAPVRVTASLGEVELSGQATLPNDPALAPVRPATAVIPAAVVPPAFDGPWLALAAIVALAILAGGLAWIVVDRRHRHRQRVQQLAAYQVAAAGPASASSAALGWVDRLLERTHRAKAMRSALGAAEIPLTPGNWLLVRIGICVLLAILGALLLGPLVGGVLGIAIGWLATWALVRARSSRRQRSFAEELPDFLLLLASGLRGGLSFNHALEAVALDGKGEAPRQMRRVLRQVQVGTLLDDALMECAERMDSEDLRWTVTALSIQREVGGNLSTILDNAAATIKSREELRREVQTLSAEGRLSGYILIGLPLGVMAFLAIIRRSYVELLWTTALGVVMLSLMGVLMVLGWFWMRAIVRIKP